MRAVVLRRAGRARARDVPEPEPGPGEVADRGRRLRRLPHRPAHRRRRARPSRSCRCPRPPDRRARPLGERCRGDRVGVPWLGWTCGECRYCTQRAARTSATARSSRATTATAASPSSRSPTSASASRCRTSGFPDLAGGAAAVRRADRLPHAAAGGRRRAARHLRLRRGRAHRRPGRACTRAGGCSRSSARATSAAQAFARELGAEWAGGSIEPPPEELDAAIIFAPVGELVPAALRARRRRAAPSSAAAST